jgi:outer membrane protein assembly factor BamB
VLADGKLYFLTDSGRISCLDAATGAPYYLQQRLGKSYNLKASPVAVNGKLYLATEEGHTVVVKMGEKFEILAVNTLADQSFIASPAVADGASTCGARMRFSVFAPVAAAKPAAPGAVRSGSLW